MRHLGFSTGALCLGDFRQALCLLHQTSLSAVELSALRMAELPDLVSACRSLDLSQFAYVSFHAPSSFSVDEEARVVGLLGELPKQWPIVVHPDSIFDVRRWRVFGSQLAIENMDRRKKTGRTVSELAPWLRDLPEAQFCFDLAHAHQCDRTMTEAFRILRAFGDRVCQLHISEIDSAGKHFPLSYQSMRAFSEIVQFLPADCAGILESMNPFLNSEEGRQVLWMQHEADKARSVIHQSASDENQASDLGTISFNYVPSAV